MSEITKPAAESSSTISPSIWVLFVLLIVAVYFFGLTIPLVGPDEPRYAQVAREMFERHDWITPRLGGFDWFEKPALLYWLQIVAYKLFGVSEFSARIGSALFGLGTVVSMWLFGKFGNGPRGENDTTDARTRANWLALITATSIGIIVFSRGASFDIILTFPMTASLAGFFIFDSAIRNSSEVNSGIESSSRFRASIPLFAFYFFVGVSLIAKGLVGVIFPFAIVAFYYLLSWRMPPKRFILSLFWGFPLLVLVAGVWYLPMYERNGYKFIDEFIIQHHFQRFTSNKFQHPQPFYFFLWVLPLMTIPWLPFFVTGIWAYFRDAIRRVSAHARPYLSPSPFLTFALAWLLFPLVFFSLSGSKLPGYILPALPAAAIFAADSAIRFLRRGEPRRIALLGLAAATLLVVAALLQFVVPRFAEADSVRSLIAAADAKGYSGEKVLGLHTVSHNAEFYAAGRLVRDPDGKQRKFSGVGEIVQAMRENNSAPVLVLVPVEKSKELAENAYLSAEKIADNGDLALFRVSAAQP